MMFLQLSVLSRQVGDLQADNLKLYEKIRFLRVIFFWSFEYSGIRKKDNFPRQACGGSNSRGEVAVPVENRQDLISNFDTLAFLLEVFCQPQIIIYRTITFLL